MVSADRAGEPGRADVQGPAQAGRRARLRLGDRREVRPHLRAARGADRRMKVFLLHRDRDFDVKPELRDEIFDAMLSANLFAVTNVSRNLERSATSGSGPRDRQATTCWRRTSSSTRCGTRWRPVTSSCSRRPARRALEPRDPEAIVYRQRVLADCLEHPEIVRELYALAIEALGASGRSAACGTATGPSTILHRSVQVLEAARRTSSGACAQIARRAGRGLPLGRLHALLRDAPRGARRRLPADGRGPSAASSSSSAACSRAPSSARATRAAATSCTGTARAALDGAAAVREPPAELQLHDPAPRRQAGFRRWRTSAGKASTSSRTRSRNPPTTSRASSPCCGSSSRSTSAA